MTEINAYMIGYLRDVQMGAEIAEYISRLDATLTPFGGRMLVHGSQLEPVEGEWDGDLVLIGFPDKDSARGWYRSPAYQEILPLRTGNSRGIVALLEGAPDGYRAADFLSTVAESH